MKRRLLFLSFLIIGSQYNAQKTTINWEGSTSIDYGLKKEVYPHFNNGGFIVDSYGVSINVVKKNNGNTLLVENLQWEKANPKDLFDLNIDMLPNDDNYDINYYFNDKENAQVASATISTFKKIKNEVYKLKSFDLNNSNKTLALKKASNIGTTENPLKSGNFYKIKVDKSGVFKITRQFLQSNGINPSSVNPKNLRVYGNGGVMLPEFNQDSRFSSLQENAIQVVGEDDGVWNDGDYALFYAKGPNGFNDYNGNERYIRTDTRRDRSRNQVNIYEDFSYYFISFDQGPGKRIQNDDLNTPSTLITRYDEYQVINEEKFNLLKLGRIWTGDAFTGNKTVSFTTNSPLRPEDPIYYKTRVISYKGAGNSISINLNGNNSANYNVTSGLDFVSIDSFTGNISGLSGNKIDFNYNANIGTNPNGQFYWDYAEIIYKQDLSFNNAQMNFRSYSIPEATNELHGFSISNTNSLEQVWEVSDITNVKNKVNKNSNNSIFNFGYLAASDFFNNEFVAFNHTAAYTPLFVSRIDNQDLSSLSNVDYLIITQKNLIGEAQRLANYHRTKNGFNVEVVDVNHIYNEFSSGSKDITAIRDFITKLNNPSGQLKYVFILGDTSYDFKNRIANNSDVMPSYQSEESHDYSSTYVTDDYFVMTRPQTAIQLSNNLPNIPIGRLPAANSTEAKLMIDKTLAYYNALPGQSSPFGEWRMKLDFIVDDDADNQFPFHNTMNESLVTNFETSNERKEYNVRKLYLDAFPAEISAGGQRMPQVNQAISNDVGNSLYLFYFGHGGINGWAQERVLSSTEIQNFNNYNNIYSRLPLISTITCEFTLWDEPNTNSAGEQIIKHKTGGSATMITSSRAIGVTYGERFTSRFTNNVFSLTNDNFNTLGNSFLKAKNEYGTDPNHLKVNFLGDPAMTLSRPKRLLKIDNIESPTPGKIRALDFIKIHGHVTKDDGTLDTSFNGRIAINIFDKKLNKKTLNNDNQPKLNPVLQYKEEGGPIVKASSTVVDGKYTVEFYVPKDINYETGEGRILAYADNKNIDVFTNQTQTIGDINPDGINDSEAPKINLYMNNINFADGGITDQNPNLLACITDNTGINSTGSGIGHDITVILDGEVINTVVLNDFFTSGESNGCINPTMADYQKGNVMYPFRNLKPGDHQLTFKVWDINNNSTTSTLNFVVKDESQQQLVINKPLNWPNPFTNRTYVHFEHNCDDILDVNVQIYTITGKIVRTLSTTVTAEPFLEGYRTPRQAIEWDGKDDFGDTVAKGTYIFKIFARSQNQDKCKGSATAVEKMVLLK